MVIKSLTILIAMVTLLLRLARCPVILAVVFVLVLPCLLLSLLVVVLKVRCNMIWSAKDIERLDSLIEVHKDILNDLVNHQKEISERILRYRVELACLEHCREEVV